MNIQDLEKRLNDLEIWALEHRHLANGDKAAPLFITSEMRFKYSSVEGQPTTHPGVTTFAGGPLTISLEQVAFDAASKEIERAMRRVMGQGYSGQSNEILRDIIAGKIPGVKFTR